MQVSDLPSLALTTSWHQEIQVLADCIKQKPRGSEPLQILEAGCGQKWDLKLGDTPYVLTGVDYDPAALEIRKNVVKDLDKTIVGDLRTARLTENFYDVIFCSYVLEHVQGARTVLENFVRWLKPDGMVIVQIPDPHSVKGFVTRMTPHWFHVFFYRHVRGFKHAGEPGHQPYPTHYDAVVSRRGMREFCRHNGLAIKAEFGCGWRTHGKGLMRVSIDLIQWLMSKFSLGALSSRHDDITFVMQREPQAETEESSQRHSDEVAAALHHS
jgi:2-polyprenyl-3-methyl-5-hydroxy-6-metoxy-1,4-benzoquinol methylase